MGDEIVEDGDISPMHILEDASLADETGDECPGWEYICLSLLLRGSTS